MLEIPQPDAQGIRETKEAFKQHLGKDLTDLEAYEILSRLMRYIFLVNNPDFELPEADPKKRALKLKKQDEVRQGEFIQAIAKLQAEESMMKGKRKYTRQNVDFLHHTGQNPEEPMVYRSN